MVTPAQSTKKRIAGFGQVALLRKALEESTPFELGDFEDQQLLMVLSSDPFTTDPEGLPKYSWTGHAVKTEKWLFLHVVLGEKEKSKWSFGFDCNDPEALVFLRQMLRQGPLIVAFPGPRKASRLDAAGKNLVENLGDKLEQYLPWWKDEYKS